MINTKINKYIIKIFIGALILIITLYTVINIYNINETKKSTKQFKKRKSQKIERYEKRLINKRIKGFEKIIENYKIKKFRYYIFYIYRKNDCGTCIKKGLQLIHKLDTFVKDTNNIFIVSLDSNNLINNTFNQRYKKIIGKKFFTNNDLNLLQTPLLVLINGTNFKIIDVYFSFINLNNKKSKSQFIDKIKDKNK